MNNDPSNGGFTENDDLSTVSKEWTLITDPSMAKDILDSEHIASFNQFMKETLNKIVEEVPPIEVKQTAPTNDQTMSLAIKFKAITAFPPVFWQKDTMWNLSPDEARERKITYASPLHVDYHVMIYKNGELQKTRKWLQCFIGKIPMMLRADFCLLRDLHAPECEEGSGYFIVNGEEKILMARNSDDKGHGDNKSQKLAGPIFALLFKKAFYILTELMRPKMQRCVDRGYYDISSYEVMDKQWLTDSLSYALETGKWGVEIKSADI